MRSICPELPFEFLPVYLTSSHSTFFGDLLNAVQSRLILAQPYWFFLAAWIFVRKKYRQN